MIFLVFCLFCKLSDASFKNAMININKTDSKPSTYHSLSLGMLNKFLLPRSFLYDPARTIIENLIKFSDSLPLVANQLETALTDAADSADLDDGAENENFISNVLQKVFMDSKFAGPLTIF